MNRRENLVRGENLRDLLGGDGLERDSRSEGREAKPVAKPVLLEVGVGQEEKPAQQLWVLDRLSRHNVLPNLQK